MKTLLKITFLSFLTTNLLAQSALISPNSMTIPKVAALTTCDATTKGQEVFLTTDNKMYYCNGTNWQEMTGGGFTLPYAASTSSANTLLSLTNPSAAKAIYGESTSGIGIHSKSTNYIGLYSESVLSTAVNGVSSSGYGGYFVSSTGSALGINGKFNANGSTGSLGSTLTVNSIGNPYWQYPVAFSAKDVGVNSLSVANNIDVKIPFTLVDYDLNTDYNVVNNEFTAPIKGVYHFDAFILWNALSNNVGYVALTLKVDGFTHSTIRIPSATSGNISNSLSVDVLLNAGSTVSLVAFQTTGATQTINNDFRTVRFTGHLVWRQ